MKAAATLLSRAALGCGLVVPAIFFLTAAIGAPSSSEEARTHDASEATQRATEYTILFRQIKQLEAEKALQKGSPELEDPSLLREIEGVDLGAKPVLQDLLEEKAGSVVGDFDKALAILRAQGENLFKRWQSIRAELHRRQILAFEARASRRIAGQMAYLLSVDNRWFWFFGVVGIATVAGLAGFERRHEIRRMLNGGRARAMGLSKVLLGGFLALVVITLSVFIFGDRIYQTLLVISGDQAVDPRVELRAKIDELQGQVGKHPGKESGVQRNEAPGSDAKARLEFESKESRRLISEIAAEISVQAEVAKELREDIQELSDLNQEAAADEALAARYHRMRQWITGLLGMLLLGGVGSCGYLFWRAVERRQQKNAKTCMLCMRVGGLTPVPNPGGGPERDGEFEEVECKAIIGSGQECGFIFKAAYREMIKLCFPTLGVPRSGKTFWLAMVYRLLNQSCPPQVDFETVHSGKSEEFDREVELIIQHRMAPSRTQPHSIPHPLIFNFADRDLLLRSNILVSIFDYSGEITRERGIDDYQRRRALDGDGFLFFLDPTSESPSEVQANALARFREDLRVIKKLKPGRQIRAPIALCVSKIDLMVNEPYAARGGKNDISKFYAALREIDPSGGQLDLKRIEARSRLIADLRDTIWPGWEIEKQIDRLFGGRFMFFPLTPVGLNEIGSTNLSERVISPYAILEPLVWLLQMNGYPIVR
jgi:Double-GTPase 2